MGHAPALSDAFRDAMAQLAGGVVMVTSWHEREAWGLTVSACCSVSVEPPLLLVSLGETTVSARTIADSGRFGVSVLGERSLAAARFGSAQGRAKFVAHLCRHDAAGAQASRSPVLKEAIVHVDCAVAQKVSAGDHLLFVGRVDNVLTVGDDRPLVYHARQFRRLADSSVAGVLADEAVFLVDVERFIGFGIAIPTDERSRACSD